MAFNPVLQIILLLTLFISLNIAVASSKEDIVPSRSVNQDQPPKNKGKQWYAPLTIKTHWCKDKVRAYEDEIEKYQRLAKRYSEAKATKAVISYCLMRSGAYYHEPKTNWEISTMPGLCSKNKKGILYCESYTSIQALCKVPKYKLRNNYNAPIKALIACEKYKRQKNE